MNKEQLIEKWEKEIVLNEKSIERKTLQNFIANQLIGQNQAISSILKDLKNLDVEPDKQGKKTCRNTSIKREVCNSKCDKCVYFK